MPSENDIKIKSIKKTVDVLNCFTEKQPLGVTEISEMLGTYKSGVYRILASLTQLGYLEQDSETEKYYLGMGVLRLSRAARERFGFREAAVKYAKEIADEFGEVVRLSVPMERDVYYLDIINPANGRFYAGNLTAFTDPMHCTSSGKAIMACRPESFVEEYYSRPVASFTKYTITELGKMKKELLKIRAQGYAVDNMENVLGLACVGVPIIDTHNNAVAALSISGTVQNGLPETEIKKRAARLRECARKIEQTL